MKIGPKYKICKRLGSEVFSQCQTQKFQIAKSKKQGAKKISRKPRTEYGTQLIEKQKVRYSYYISEKQLSNYVKKARVQKGTVPTQALFSSLESRLDNVVYRAGFASTRGFARQIVSHGHIFVNGKRTTVPSYQLKAGDVVSIRPESKKNHIFTGLKENIKNNIYPSWFSYDEKNEEVTIKEVPALSSAQDGGLDLATVVEFYSRV